MTGQNETQTIPLPPVHHYNVIYEDLVHDLAILMAHDQREHWAPMLTVDADETINQPKLDYLKEHIAALEEEYVILYQTSKELITTGKNWMIDAAKHPSDVREPQIARHKQLRDDHDVPRIESNAKEKLAAFREEISKLKATYRAAKGILSQTGGIDTSNSSNNLFPTASGAFGAHTSGQTHRIQHCLQRFFGVLAEATTSVEPLKITGQVIDKFSGDITHWPLFREQFVKLAHRPGNFSDDIERFYFLLSQLEGEAKKWVSDTPPVKGCYQHAADQLEKKYGNERELYKQLLQKFNQIKPLPPGCSAHQLAEFVKVATNCLAGIASLGRADTTGRSLEELEEKLPPDLRKEVSRRRSRDRLWDIIKLEAYLLEEVDILRATYGDKGHSSGTDATKTRTAVAFTPRNNGPPRSSTRPTKTSVTPMCVFCPSRDHWGSNCTKFASISDRIRRITELRKCYFCLNDHLADVCDNPAARMCRHCHNEKHHICFCPERNRNGRQTSKTHSAKFEPVYQDLNEPSSDSEADDNGPDQNVEGSEGFDDETNDAQTKNTGTYAILSNKENGTHRTTLLECVKVTVGHPTDKSQQCETVLLLDSASDHTYFKQSLCEKLNLPNLGPTKLSVATFLSSEEILVDTFNSQLRIRKSNGKTICLKAPVMPDQFVGRMRTAFVRPEHITELRQGSCAVCPSTETPEILVGRDLRHLFEVVEEHKPLPCGFLLAHSNVGTMLVGSGKADKPADESELSAHRSFFVRAMPDDVSIDQLLEPLHADDNLAQNIVSSFRNQLEEREPHKVLHVSERAADQKLADLLHQMHSLEQMGVEPPSHLDEDDAVHQRIRDSIRWVDGRYEVGLPWRTSDGQPPSSEELSDNFKYAFACLQALVKTLGKENLLAEYDKIFTEYLASGIISEFTGRPSHYLSHHAVIKRSSTTTKTRPVFNGSAKPDKTSPSMNDMLHKGPVLLNPITAVLLNSRLASYVLSSDIAKAFLQVALRPDEKRFCCFLWVRDLTRPATGDNMVTYCFNRVIFGLRPSPALLAVVIEKHMQTVDTPLSREILANCYVDNIYLTADDLAEAQAKYKASKGIFADMNMNLREFATNDPEFNQALPKEDQAHFDGFKQLGINWDLNTDVWVFDFKVGILDENWAPKPKKGRKKTSKETSQTSMRPTKRMMSSTTLSRFDPLGLVNPAILPARLSVQTACKEKYGWDDPVDNVLVDQWNKAVSCWTSTVIYVPRLIKPKTSEVVDLHVFCDASGHSYGACAYLVVQHSDATRSAHLIFSRSRLKPLNANLTIPRLELMAGVLGARLVDFLQKQLTVKAPKVTLHTDSQVVFFWIKSLEKQPVFVENRLKEIRALLDLHSIALRYVPTELNPADVLSRGIRADQLQDHDLWWHGPPFLKESDVSLWPSQPEVTEYEDADQSLEQMIEREIVMSTTARFSKLDYIANPEEFNEWSKLLDQSCACLFRVVTLLRSIAVKRQTLSFVPAPLFPLVSDVTLFKPDNPTSLADLQATEKLILRITQSQHPPTIEETRQLRLSCDQDGLIRANSRITRARDIPTTAYNPIFLSRKARVTALLIHFHHDSERHLGTNAILASIRRRFWFTSGRRTVQTAVRQLCRECAIWNAKPLQIPEWPSLPEPRVNKYKPFSHIGLDNFGSYTVKDTHAMQTVHKKVWVLIVSCLTTRCIWMDVVLDMSAESFINAFKRHMAQNGTPFSVICDNATNFVAGGEALKRVSKRDRPAASAENLRRSLRQTVKKRQLKDCMDQSNADASDETSVPSVEFKHIPEYAPWRGATYERLIGNAKYCIKRAIGRKVLPLDDFRTLIAEVTRAVNERPIAYMADRVDEFTLLRPIDFLAPLTQDRPVLNPTASLETDDARDQTYRPDRPTAVDRVVDMWTEQARRLETFWSTWHESILLGSLEKGTRPDKTTSNKRPKGQTAHALIGQYVLVKDQSAPQFKWKRAQILDLIESSDGVIRTATIRLPSGTVSRRAINHLYPIDVELDTDQTASRVTVNFCRVTRMVSDTTMNCDSELELDYDEEMPTSDQRPAYGQDQRKRFEVNERIVLPSDGPIPVLDSHLHADEVEKHARDQQVFPPVYATWSQDQAFRPTRHDQFQFAGYVTVFCRPNTFLSLDSVQRVAGSSYYPMDMCLGACVGVHPGNCEDWHQRNDLELYLAGCLYNATLGPYRVVGLGECGLDYTKKAVVRDENGVVQTIHGRPLQSRDIEALRQHQYPVLEKQLSIVVTRLRKVDGGYYPVVLHLRNRDDQQTDVHADAIGIMRRVGMPKDYPIHCHYWTGGRTHYDNWTSHFPNTLFGFNAGSFSRGLSPDQLDLLRTIPLDQVTFESDAPYHGKRGTSQTIGTPAGVVRAITQFKELGSRPESLQTIAQASMANVIRMYRPDLTVIIEKTDEDDARESQTSPSDQTNRIGPNTTTMFELASICDAGCDGPHRQCSDVFLVKGPDDEGLILSNRWTRAVTDLHVTTNLRNVRVTSFVHLVLCLWGGRLLQDRPQEMVQFFEELLGYPPDQSSDVLSRWYSRITGGSAKKFRAIQASDVRLALRKRFHACSLARSWMQTSSPPFQYEYPHDHYAGASEAATLFQSILQLMPEALSWTYDQFVQTTVTVGRVDPDQPGPSRQAYRQTSSHGTSLSRGMKASQTSHLGIKKPNQSRFKRSHRPDASKQLIQKMIDLFLETTGTSGQVQPRHRQQKRPHRETDE
ncbi:Pao retrotransposon peptidase family protein [Aphelenchoides avenae]|nr:Pao retrotransposon peptidase family protein [Aphelenchus avenae]